MSGIIPYTEPPFRIQPKTDVTSYDGYLTCNVLPGFVGDGDYITLPTSGTGTLTYHDAAGTLQWSKAHTDINAAVDNWVGFRLHATQNRLFVYGLDIGTAPATVYMSYINAGGAVTSHGNAQLGADFTADPVWPNSSILVIASDWAILELANLEVCYVNGDPITIAVDPAPIHANAEAYKLCYKTANGVWVGAIDSQSNVNILFDLSSDDGRSVINLLSPGEGGLAGQADALSILQWRGYLALANANTGLMVAGGRFFEVAEFEAKIEELARRHGVV